jgi:hypothetical protein
MQAVLVELGLQEKLILHKIFCSKTLGSALKERAQIVLAASEGLANRQIVREYDIEEHRVGIWRRRWHKKHEAWKKLDPELRPKMSKKLVCQWLADASGRGCKPEITEEQRTLILAVACEPPEQSGYPHTHWTDRLLAAEVIKRGIVEYVSHVWIWNFLKSARAQAAQKPVLAEREHRRSRTIRARGEGSL